MNKAKAAFNKATKLLHEKKTFVYQDKPVKALHKAINDVFTEAIDTGITHEVPAKMLQSLRKDVFIFSGMKTYAELKEASQLLTTPAGDVKPYHQFAEDVKKINSTYNDNYLQAEYRFATGSAQMAANWAEIDQANDLQYRTAQDDRVRADHAALANITLPATDQFWDNYYPPNGWNCRCLAVEVLPGKYERSDSNTANALGDAATTKIGKNGKNSMEIFRFNPGKQERIFPPKHPYYAQHCGKKLNVSGNIALAMMVLNNERDKCQFQKEVEAEVGIKEEQKAARKAKDVEINEWAKANIPPGGKMFTKDNFKTKTVEISRKSITSIASHFTEPALKEVAKHVISKLDECTFLESAHLDPSKPNYETKLKRGVSLFNYYEFEWNGQKLRLNTEVINGEFEKPYSVNIIK